MRQRLRNLLTFAQVENILGVFQVIVTIVLFATSQVLAECADLRPLQDANIGYAQRGDRCEGYYLAEVAQQLTLLSVTRGAFPSTFKKDTTVTIFPPAESPLPLFLRGSSALRDTHYRLDVELTPGRSFSWSVGEVLLPGGLNAHQVGIYGWIGPEEDKIFVPVRVTVEDSKKPLLERKLATLIVLRADRNAAGVWWRAWSSAQGECLAPKGTWNKARVIHGPPSKAELSWTGWDASIYCVEAIQQIHGRNMFDRVVMKVFQVR